MTRTRTPATLKCSAHSIESCKVVQESWGYLEFNHQAIFMSHWCHVNVIYSQWSYKVFSNLTFVFLWVFYTGVFFFCVLCEFFWAKSGFFLLKLSLSSIFQTFFVILLQNFKMQCLIHVCHNSFWAGLKKYVSDAEELVQNMYCFITKSPAKRVDLFDID